MEEKIKEAIERNFETDNEAGYRISWDLTVDKFER